MFTLLLLSLDLVQPPVPGPGHGGDDPPVLPQLRLPLQPGEHSPLQTLPPLLPLPLTQPPASRILVTSLLDLLDALVVVTVALAALLILAVNVLAADMSEMFDDVPEQQQ